MFQPVALYIGLRYSRSKRKNHFISVVTLFSMLGIFIGVMALITVISVMNGFDEAIEQRIFSMVPHVTVNAVDGNLENWQGLAKQVQEYPGVVAEAPFINGQGMLTYMGQNQPVLITGILPEQEQKISALGAKMSVGKLTDLKPGEFSIVLGEQLAQNLGVYLGDKIRLMIPQYVVSPIGVNPVYKRFTVAGIFSIGPGFGFDSRLAYIHLEDAQALFNLNKSVTGLRLKVKDVLNANRLSGAMQATLPAGLIASDWTSQFGALFKTLALEKTMMFIILSLIIMVAAFNLISSLVMLVTDKQADIAILRTLGARPSTILLTFMVQGLMVGIVGTSFGVCAGLILAWNATAIVTWIQQTLHVTLMTSGMYFVDYLPSKIDATQVVGIGLLSLLFCLIATLYPAFRAASVHPAEALRYE